MMNATEQARVDHAVNNMVDEVEHWFDRMSIEDVIRNKRTLNSRLDRLVHTRCQALGVSADRVLPTIRRRELPHTALQGTTANNIWIEEASPIDTIVLEAFERHSAWRITDPVARDTNNVWSNLI